MQQQIPASGVPQRVDGYAPLRDYAAIGDGRTVALVARDGTVDWLPLPDLDSPAAFAGVLDSGHGGSFLLRPELPFSVSRRYLPGTNVLETIFQTERGAVKVSDALTLPDGRLEPLRELQRRVDGLFGRVPLRWCVEPRFDYGRVAPSFGWRLGYPVASSGSDAIGLVSIAAGEPHYASGGWSGRFEIKAGQSALLALSFAHQEPLLFPARDEFDNRFQHTCATWRRWSEQRTYEGPWREAVIRSALALKLLVFAPTGAIAAAATASLPELIGGQRNWDYRYSWIRDSAFTIDAFLQLGCPAEAQAYFWWLMHATQLTSRRLHALYRLDGGTRTEESVLPLAGYRDSRPVNIGNGAAEQLQLDSYGELLQTAWLYAHAGNRIDRDVGHRLAALADFVCEHGRQPDAGIWEVRGSPVQFTQSKMMCAIALDRAAALAQENLIPNRHLARWGTEAAAIRRFVDTHCWSARKCSYVRASGSDDLDASLLLAALHNYADPSDARLRSTIDAISRELRNGPFVHRYRADDGLPGSEGAFLACSFWLVEALARSGDRDQANQLMSELAALANDVGLYSEEIDPESGDFLGNMPQGLSHLALIRAAVALANGER